MERSDKSEGVNSFHRSLPLTVRLLAAFPIEREVSRNQRFEQDKRRSLFRLPVSLPRPLGEVAGELASLTERAIYHPLTRFARAPPEGEP